MFQSLGDFFRHLTVEADVILLPQHESWEEMMHRIQRTGCIHAIDEETYDWFLDVLPPKWMTGNSFAFAEGAEALRLFWVSPFQGERYFFTRTLTVDETTTFCRLARVPLPS